MMSREFSISEKTDTLQLSVECSNLRISQLSGQRSKIFNSVQSNKKQQDGSRICLHASSMSGENLQNKVQKILLLLSSVLQ